MYPHWNRISDGDCAWLGTCLVFGQNLLDNGFRYWFISTFTVTSVMKLERIGNAKNSFIWIGQDFVDSYDGYQGLFMIFFLMIKEQVKVYLRIFCWVTCAVLRRKLDVILNQVVLEAWLRECSGSFDASAWVFNWLMTEFFILYSILARTMLLPFSEAWLDLFHRILTSQSENCAEAVRIFARQISWIPLTHLLYRGSDSGQVYLDRGH